ncbi:MAG: phosphotransferase family protein [Enterobacterales bacterium]|nr:phosphotransferase family protein [Enterobacterales bacterium]
MTIDMAGTVRDEDALPLDTIKAYLCNVLDDFNGTENLDILQYPAGASNLTYELKLPSRSIILRTAPKGANIKSAHDMGREFQVLSRLGKHFTYCPRPVAHCTDDSVIGREFYLMEKIEGMIPRQKMPTDYQPEQLTALCQQMMDIQLELHQIDIKDTGLIEMGKPIGYVERQVTGWCERYRNARTDDVPDGNALMTWLTDHQPDDSYAKAEQASFIHNDYKLDNIVLDSHQPDRIISVLDWEMATVGDPLMDLGNSMAYWINANDSGPMQHLALMPTRDEGMLTREGLVDYYLSNSGLSIKSFDYYHCFGLFRLAVIAQQIYKRYKEGKTTNPKFAAFGQFVQILIGATKRYY